jgi:hypothetical protein
MGAKGVFSTVPAVDANPAQHHLPSFVSQFDVEMPAMVTRRLSLSFHDHLKSLVVIVPASLTNRHAATYKIYPLRKTI